MALAVGSALVALSPSTGGVLLGLAGLGLGLGRVWGVFVALTAGTFLVTTSAQTAELAAGVVALTSFVLLAPWLLRHDWVATVMMTLACTWLGVAGGMACSKAPHQPTARKVGPSDLVNTTGLEEPPVHHNPVQLQRICTPAAKETAKDPPSYRRKIVYDFVGIDVHPAPEGPRIALAPRHGPPRSVSELSRALDRSRVRLKECYRWARYRQPGLQGIVTVDLHVDAFGVARRVTARAETSEGAELAGCTAKVLDGLQLGLYPFRRTHATVRLRFRPSGQGRPHEPPPNPNAPPMPTLPSGVCVQVPRDAAPDRLTGRYPVISVDDFDKGQERWEKEQEYQRKLRRWRRGQGPRPVRQPVVIFTSACGCHSSFNKRDIQRALRSNLGAYQACYRSALVRRKGMRGTVTLQGVIDESGSVRLARVQRSDVADPALERCLTKAMKQVWLVPTRDMGLVIVSVPFHLKPQTVPPPAPVPARTTVERLDRHAAAQLDAGYVAQAARSYRALLRQRPQHKHACRWQAQLAVARWKMAPWSDQQTWREMRALAGSPKQCEEQKDVLTPWAVEPHRMALKTRRRVLYEQAATRYRALLRRLPPGSTAYTLRFYLGEVLFSLERYGEAGRQFLRVAAQGGMHGDEAGFAAVICARNLLLP